jgi:hypothetical protein
MPGAPPGSNRSTAGYDASSAGPTAPTLCSSARRMTPNCGGASPTSRRTRSPGAPRVHATRVPAGTSTSKCWPPEITPLEPAHYRNRSAYGMQASRELAAGQDGRARTTQIWLIGAPGPAPSRSSLRARIRRYGRFNPSVRLSFVTVGHSRPSRRGAGWVGGRRRPVFGLWAATPPGSGVQSRGG